jgi:CRISPR-associated protein Cas2
MWTLVLFDLPVKTKEQRRNYRDFRKALLEFGFTRLQFSCYIRFAPNDERAQVYMNRITEIPPPKGEVRVLQITGKQFEKMKVFIGFSQKRVEKEPSQLEFF